MKGKPKIEYSNQMKIVYLILFYVSLFTLSAQKSNTTDKIIKDSLDGEFIMDYKKRFNVKLELSNDISTYSFVENGFDVELKPNLNLRYAVVFSYKFLSVRLGIRPKISEENIKKKGDSDTFRLRLLLLFDKWNHLIEYKIDKGFYLVNTQDFIDQESDIRIQFPELSSHVLFGSSSYKFNKNYSLRAIQSQTEVQMSSAGSFMPGISYNFYKFSGTNVIKNIDGDKEFRDYYNEYSGASLSLLLGYYYTFVLKKHWYVNAFAIPTIGFDFYTTKIYGPDESTSRRFNDDYLALNYGVGSGYNGEKIFFGAEFKNRFTNEKFSSSKVSIIPKNTEFKIFFGYRFKAPKTVRKPVDYIEKKVPILKDENH